MAILDHCASKPSPARIQNALLGGHDNSAADREIARALAEKHPVLGPLNRQNRRFTGRAVRWLAGDGIRQYLDLGCGLPVKHRDGTREPMVHEAAGEESRVIYVDHDPIVVLHTAAAVAGEGNVTVVKADLADPDSVLIGEHVQEMGWPGEPAAVIFASVLHYWPADVARELVSWYADALPPRSAVVVSCAFFEDDAAMDERRRRLPSLPFFNHDERTVESFFEAAGLHLYAPVGDVAPMSLAGGKKSALMLGGVGFKG